jgi:hypothetical protein
MRVKFRTKNGKPLHLGNIYLTLRNHFYYGTFEYPKGSGEWYKGAHIPLISKVLFDQVQEKIAQQNSRGSGVVNKEFAFTKLMTCGLCGSGITADEKYKTQKNGTMRRYVYYGCCKSTDKNCKSGYINEEDLIEQLVGLMNEIEFNEIGMRQKIKEEIERHKRFQSGLLGIKETKIAVKDVEVRNYAKYILRDGQIYEKRELLLCMRSKITVANKIICLK